MKTARFYIIGRFLYYMKISKARFIHRHRQQLLHNRLPFLANLGITHKRHQYRNFQHIGIVPPSPNAITSLMEKPQYFATDFTPSFIYP